MVCEAAGFDVILVETVGVGQSEITVCSMVDFFLLLMLSGAGDELQGIKKGFMELADALVINKADGENRLRAETARNEYERGMHYLQPSTEGWISHAYTCSSLENRGIDKIWSVVETYRKITRQSGIFDAHRKKQTMQWVDSMVDEHLRTLFTGNSNVSTVKSSKELILPVVFRSVLPCF